MTLLPSLLRFLRRTEDSSHAFLHNRTAIELQNWLQLYGLSLVILSIRIGPQSRRPVKESIDRQSA